MGMGHRLIEACISAVEGVGENGAGKDGIVGYLMGAVESSPDLLAELLVDSLPYQNPTGEDPSKDPGQVRNEERDSRLRW